MVSPAAAGGEGAAVRDRALRFIVRVPTGWWVRIQRKLFRYTKLFADADHGGRARSLAAAKRDRDAVERTLEPSGRPQAAAPGHGYVRKAQKHGRSVWEGFVWLNDRRHARTQNLIEVWGPRVAKRRCEEWLARHRRALGARRS